MQISLPARPSLEQLKKLAKDLVKYHQEKQPDTVALISRHLPTLSGKSTEEICAFPFALHDAQSVVARQYGFPSWASLHDHIERLQKGGPTPEPDLDVAAKLETVLQAREQKDYTMFCSVMSEEMKVFVTKERFDITNDRLSRYFEADYQITYMGSVNRSGRPVHFWRLWVKGWESDILVRMVLNGSGLISGLLYSDPFDTTMSAKK